MQLASTYIRGKSHLMFGLCILFTLVILALLGMVSGYLVSLGYKSVDLALFTQSPVPAGAAGFPGGLQNGIVGSIIMIALASLVGIPIGMILFPY